MASLRSRVVPPSSLFVFLALFVLVSASAQAQVINEWVADHAGADTEELLELFGEPSSDYGSTWFVVLDETGVTDLAVQAGSTDAQGFWSTTLAADSLGDGTLTILLAESWSGSLGQDLDTNDDGTLDIEPWTTLHDDVASTGVPVRRGFARSGFAGASFTYSSSVVDGGGASRWPNGFDSDVGSDWQVNDFDGAGLDGFGGEPSVGESWNTPGAVNRTNTTDYYAAVVGSDMASLRTTLHAAVENHVRYPYSDSATDTWDILEQADEDPDNSSNILTIYRNSSIAKFGGGSGPYNREHTWPRTYGFPSEGSSYPYTDCHHLRLSDPGYNSDRGSRAFGTCNAGCTERTTETNGGVGGMGGGYPGDSNWFTGSDGGTGTWEAWDHRQGDVARSILYMAVRYEGGVHGVTGLPEPDLELTDDTGLVTGTGSNTTGLAYMGRLSTLLAWHAADPPDDDERRRNEVVYRYQGNRNPFVDHPEWADCAFLGTGCGEPPLFADGFEDGDTLGWSSSSP